MRDVRARILSLIDLTSLNDSDTDATIAVLCKKAVTPIGVVAAVCVYPQFVQQAAIALRGKAVKIATVVNFPRGTDSLEIVLRLIESAIGNGAQEIDVVFPYRLFLSGNKEAARDFVQACKKACGEEVLLKIILETGALKEKNIIAEASQIAIAAGADFLKTSTGKIEVGATLEAAEVMLLEIEKSGRAVGFKASGGVRTIDQAEKYIELADRIMGPDWATPRTFRLGASQLLETLLS